MSARKPEGFVCGPCTNECHALCHGSTVDFYCACRCVSDEYDEQVEPWEPTDEELEAMKLTMEKPRADLR